MSMWRVTFKDWGLNRSIKIMAESREEAVMKAKRLRRGKYFRAQPVMNDEHLAALSGQFWH